MMSLTTTLPRRLSLVALAITGLTAIAAISTQAADPFVAGGRSTRALTIGASDVVRVKAHGKALAEALGLPSVTQRVERLDDRFEHRTVDEVTSLDRSGRETAITRFELDGSVAMAVGLGWNGGVGRPIDAASAGGRAATAAMAAGVRVNGLPTVRHSAGAGGWSIAWPRIVNDAVVRGDGVRVQLWEDGSFHGLTRIERALAAAPATTLPKNDAQSAADAAVLTRFGDAARDLRSAHAELVWVAPNDAFGGPRMDAPAETLRLAWAVRYDAGPSIAERVQSVEIWVDAGDSTILGGDVIE